MKTNIVTKRHVDQIIAVTNFCAEPQGLGSSDISDIVNEEEIDDSFNSACSIVEATDSDTEFMGFSEKHININENNDIDQILERNVNVDLSLNNDNENILNRNVRPKRNVKAQKPLIEEI